MQLIKAGLDDWKTLLDWRNDDRTRQYSHSGEQIDEDRHREWLEGALSDPDVQLFIAVDTGSQVGTVRAEYDRLEKAYEISWTVSPDFRGRGMGKKMVRMLVDRLDSRVRAEIKAGNDASVKIAEFAGMKFKGEENGILFFSNY